MDSFLQKHSAVVTGILSGFDRLIFRGYLLRLTQSFFMLGFLRIRKIELKDFGGFAEDCSKGVKDAAKKIAEASGRQVLYLASAHERKDEKARAMAEREGITEGLIAVFTALENCTSFEIFGKSGRVGLRRAQRKCLHQYYYFIHPVLGLMHVRFRRGFRSACKCTSTGGNGWRAR